MFDDLLEISRRDRMTADQVKDLRERTGLSMVDFAEICGTSPASIYRWEKEKSPPNQMGSQLLWIIHDRMAAT